MTRAELERDIIGAVYSSPHKLPAIRRVVRPEHFTDAGFRKCYEVACDLADGGSAATPENAELAGASGSVLLECTTYGRVGAEPSLLARMMTEAVLRDNMTSFLKTATEKDDILEVYKGMDKLNSEAAALIGANKRRSKAEQVADYTRRLAANARDGVKRILSGIPTLDGMLSGGLTPGDLSLLGGTEGTGKTSFALNVSMAAASAGHRVVFIEAEMPEQEVLERMNGIHTGQDIDGIRRGTHQSDTFTEWFESVPFTLVPMFNRDPYSLRTALEYHAREADLLVVDYMQIFAGHGKQAADEFYQIKKLSETLRGLALRRNVHLMCLSSLNRSEEERKSARSFYGSSGLQHDAAVAMLLTGEKKDAEEMYLRRRNVTLSVVKNRSGIRGDVPLTFHLNNQQMVELVQGEPEYATVGRGYDYRGNGQPG